MDDHHIVIFDGVCNLCNGAVGFIIRRDPKARFLFAPMQSDLAQDLMRRHGVEPASGETMVLIKNGSCYTRSDAALEIARDLTGGWWLCGGFRVIPRFLRDGCYNMIARNRYALFGRAGQCRMPEAGVKERFIGTVNSIRT